MDNSIELVELFKVLRRRKWILIAIITLTMGLGAVYNFFIAEPVYNARTTVMVNGSKGLDSEALAARMDVGILTYNQKLVVTYVEIIKSRAVLEEVIDKLNLDMDAAELSVNITAEQIGSTEILEISVKDKNYNRAAKIANTLVEVFVKESKSILRVDNVELIDRAVPLNRPVNMSLILILAIAIALGLIFGTMVVLIIEYMDNTLKTPQDVKAQLGYTVLGNIPDFDQVKKE